MRLVVVLCIYLLTFTAGAAELRVACAANFYPTLNKIRLEFERNSGHRIIIIRGSTGKLYAQILHGAPYDIFLSADSERADKLVAQGKSADNKSRVYATGQLALWRPGEKNAEQIIGRLRSGEFNKLAIANPKTAPYGTAAVETLKSLQLYAAVKNKLVYGENISQTLQFVQSGAADLGFVARPHVKDEVFWSVGTDLYTHLDQKMVLLRQTKQPQLANEFMQFMQSPQIKKIIQADGYLL